MRREVIISPFFPIWIPEILKFMGHGKVFGWKFKIFSWDFPIWIPEILEFFGQEKKFLDGISKYFLGIFLFRFPKFWNFWSREKFSVGILKYFLGTLEYFSGTKSFFLAKILVFLPCGGLFSLAAPCGGRPDF